MIYHGIDVAQDVIKIARFNFGTSRVVTFACTGGTKMSDIV